MKKINIFILIIVMLFIGTGLYAQIASDFQVTLTDDFEGVILVKYLGNARTVTIPATFEGFPLRVIGDEAFIHSYTLTSVVIPNGVTTLGRNAFAYSSTLATVTIPASVTSIGNNAFAGCSALRSINLPANIEHIGIGAFADSGLTAINWPAKIPVISVQAFNGCRSLATVTIPAGITTIGAEAFNGCTSITTINLPATMELIQAGAFSGCSALTTVTIPDSVTIIEFEISSSYMFIYPGNEYESYMSAYGNPFNNCPRLNLASQGALRRRGWDPNTQEVWR